MNGQLLVAALTELRGAFESGHWIPGPGDPTPMGWITTIAYLAAALLCVWAGTTSPVAVETRALDGPRAFWFTLGGIMLALAVNKQLDLQMWFWQTGRNFTRLHGLYGERRLIQFGSMGAIVALSLGVFIYLRRRKLEPNRHFAIALFGVLFTFCFVIVRAISIHHVDAALGLHIGGVKINWILENGGILLVIVAALLAIRQAPPRHYVCFGGPSGRHGSD